MTWGRKHRPLWGTISLFRACEKHYKDIIMEICKIGLLYFQISNHYNWLVLAVSKIITRHCSIGMMGGGWEYIEIQILILVQWRKLRGLSQEEMAKKINVSTRTIWSYENDINNLRNASYNTISLIANALEIRIGQIFLGDNFGKTE